MKRVHMVAAVVLASFLQLLPGCDAKKKNADQAAQPLQHAVSSSKGAAAMPPSHPAVASPQDWAEAEKLKDKVLAQVKAGNFSAIYREASDGFREVGREEQFLALWQKQVQQTGAFKSAKEVSRSVRPQDAFLVFVYQVQYERVKKELRLTFGRSKKGKMELTGINHRDLQ